MIGRAYLRGWQQRSGRVENVLNVLRAGIDSAVLALGHSSVHDLTPDDLVVPPGFTRTLGVPERSSSRDEAVTTELGRLTWPQLRGRSPLW